uniref:Uncharacterized protein n=1 Tax=Strigamia maritima TaxID=126957 RepID=T1INI7_STRMM
MISAMPAVALRRERVSKIPWKRNGKGGQPPALVEYYHNKISKIANFPPTRRTYSASNSLETPDGENPPYSFEEYEQAGRCRRCCYHFTLFHVGCFFLAGGLIILFISVGSIKADMMPLRVTGSSLVAFGALLCLIWTVCCRQPEAVIYGLRHSDSLVSRAPNSATTPENTLSPTVTTTTLEGPEETPMLNGGIAMSPSTGVVLADAEETDDLLLASAIKV